jgi:membrane-bound metal-dependent hydrolase YbcI (DUF457 family)
VTPIGHVGIAVPVGYVLRLSVPVVLLCALLPDMVDRPLWAVGIGAPRFIAHTLLFVLLVALAFFLWKRAYGRAALLGGISHLLLDWWDGGAQIPWFYPFASYDFPTREFDPSSFFSNLFRSLEYNFTLSRLGHELIWIAVTVAAAYLCSRLYFWYSKRRRQRGWD